MFDTLLIANRGEIACRVAATARRLGIRTVAVYSDADANARHVAAWPTRPCTSAAPSRAPATCAPTPSCKPRASTGAQAIHPGYGFLSENADFAEAAEQPPASSSSARRPRPSTPWAASPPPRR